MTRKDYIKFAAMLKELRSSMPVMRQPDEIVDYLADEIAYIFAEDNPHFDRQRFLEAAS